MCTDQITSTYGHQRTSEWTKDGCSWTRCSVIAGAGR